jgi:AmiR/NasT family two-component response regulator
MVRTLLVRDDALGWQDLAAQLAGCSGITAVQPAADLATAAQRAVTWRPDLVVLGLVSCANRSTRRSESWCSGLRACFWCAHPLSSSSRRS